MKQRISVGRIHVPRPNSFIIAQVFATAFFGERGEFIHGEETVVGYGQECVVHGRIIPQNYMEVCPIASIANHEREARCIPYSRDR